MKILIIGDGGHGKDTLCEVLMNHGFRYASSSRFFAPYIFPSLKEKYGYSDETECWNDRHSHRQEWKSAIEKFNEDDPSTLTKLILKDYSIYNGLRSRREFNSTKELYDLIIFVDASGRVGTDLSNELVAEDAHIIITNNQTKSEFLSKCSVLANILQPALNENRE